MVKRITMYSILRTLIDKLIESHLWVNSVMVLLCPDPSGNQTVPDRVRQRVIVISDRGHVPILDKREVKVSVERLLHSHHVLDVRDGLDTDLLALLHLGLVAHNHV